MNDYISRDDAIKAIKEDKVEINPILIAIAGESSRRCFETLNQACDRHIKSIRSFPAAEVHQIKHGEWKRGNLILNRSICSICGWYTDEFDTFDFNFCPNCGAHMEDDSEVTED